MNRRIRKPPNYNCVDNYLHLIIESVLFSIHRNVAGSILDGVIWIFPSHDSSDPTLALRLTQPATKMSTRVYPRGCVELTTSPPAWADCLEILGNSNSGSRKSLSRPVMG